MKNTSFFYKILLGYLLIIFSLTILISIFSFKIIKENYIKTLTNNLKKINQILNTKFLPLMLKNDSLNIDKMAKNIGKKIRTRITVIATNGIVLGDSEKNPEDMENHKWRPEIKKALQGYGGSSIRFSRTVKAYMLYVATPIMSNNSIIGVVRTSLFLKNINLLLIKLKNQILKIALIIIFISLIGAIFLSRTLSKPIKILVNSVKKVGEGNFDIKIFLKRKDEIKELADNFNYMTVKIKKLFSEVTAEKEELNSIISSIKEGLMVLDKEGKIILANSSFYEVVKNTSITGKFYWEILRNNDFDKLINKVKNEKNNLSEIIKINEKDFLCGISFLSTKNQIIAIFYNVTEKKNIEKMKRDFVSNVSHELKTPLTAIKGFIETLLSMEKDEEKEHYLGIIDKHTERLINIVNDLLLLSELDKYEHTVEMKEIDIVRIIKSVIRMFDKKVKEKSLHIKLRVDEKIPLIKGDTFKIEEMFINLIDNSIKYTNKGEIIISIKKMDKFLKIEIEDTGIGIPEKDIDRIFERFYVVDKSRSRKMGGTGLGLSIVKYIVLLHKGKISVKSEQGKGTVFMIELPL